MVNQIEECDENQGCIEDSNHFHRLSHSEIADQITQSYFDGKKEESESEKEIVQI